MKPTIIDIVSNVVVRDYINHFWEVATDTVSLKANDKNKYYIRRVAEKLIISAIEIILKNMGYQHEIDQHDTIEILLYKLWEQVSEHYSCYNIEDLNDCWLEYLSQLRTIVSHLEFDHAWHLSKLIDKNNAS